eukprot:2081326-Rhodomonas_salina.4
MQRNLAMQRGNTRQINEEAFTSHPRLESISKWNFSVDDHSKKNVENPIAARRDRADEIVQNQMLVSAPPPQPCAGLATEVIQSFSDPAVHQMAKVSRQMQQEGGWVRWFFGIGKQHGGLSGSKIIHPASPCSQIIVTTSALLLLYSAVVSSTLVGFLWFADPCNKMPTLEFDMFVDVFFIFEIVITFFIGVFHQVWGKIPNSTRAVTAVG